MRERLPAPLDVISDAAIATGGVGHGRLIPLIILDTRRRPDVEEAIRVHHYLSEGEVLVNWAKLPYDHVGLVLKFVRPVEVVVVVRFSIEHRGGVVDQILSARSLYLQAGKPGDRYIGSLDATRILIEIPDTGFQEIWSKLLKKSIIKTIMARGVSRKDAHKLYDEFLREWRKLGRFRMP